jgi:S1-C subfamily serine protease
MKPRTWLIAVLLVGGFLWYTNRTHNVTVQKGDSPPLWSEPVAHSAGLNADELNNIDIYKASQAAVVFITSTVRQQDFFFGTREAQGIGSGFIISTDGQILTNNHVVSGSEKLEVTFTDKTRLPAQIVMRMPSEDLALIKIDAKGKQLPVLRLGDSDALQVGQKVLAIGNPLGLSSTLTTGIVSALNRNLPAEDQELEGLIQTDAAINGGNSGGPLLDSQGNVIGINTMIIRPSGEGVGFGFAMPINRAKRMLEDFRSGRRPAKSIGVQTALLDPEWAEALELPKQSGLLVLRVGGRSAADRASLKGATRRVRLGNTLIDWGGDFITQIDGKPVQAGDDIIRAVNKKHAGESIELTLIRAGRSMKVTVTLEALDDAV